jgi:hypothetical protein
VLISAINRCLQKEQRFALYAVDLKSKILSVSELSKSGSQSQLAFEVDSEPDKKKSDLISYFVCIFTVTELPTGSNLSLFSNLILMGIF